MEALGLSRSCDDDEVAAVLDFFVVVLSRKRLVRYVICLLLVEHAAGSRPTWDEQEMVM